MTVAIRPMLPTSGKVRSERGEGPDARRLSELWDQVSRHSAITGRAIVAHASLDEAVSEATEANWDGYGARPIKQAAYDEAQWFIAALPGTVPLPDVGVVPDGGISLEWYRSPRSTFSVVIRGSQHITYAGLFGLNTAHGMEVLFENEIPRVVVESIARVISDASTSGSA